MCDKETSRDCVLSSFLACGCVGQTCHPSTQDRERRPPDGPLTYCVAVLRLRGHSFIPYPEMYCSNMVQEATVDVSKQMQGVVQS